MVPVMRMDAVGLEGMGDGGVWEADSDIFGGDSVGDTGGPSAGWEG